MACLEDLKPGALVKGLTPNNLVTIIDVKWYGSVGIELTYKDANGRLGSELLYRHNESMLEIAPEGLPWSFDADGSLFRLTSEAYRIHLAYLFDPLIAVHTSLIEPLPHQITAVYETMLSKQPLRYLLAAISNGVESMWWERETFAYADGWDPIRNRYRGLRAGQHVQAVLNTESLLVKPDVATRQLAAEQAPSITTASTVTSDTSKTSTASPTLATSYTSGQTHPGSVINERSGSSILESAPVTTKSELRRFHGAVKLNEHLMGRDAGRISEEVVRHLLSLLGAKVEVTLEISAELPDGASESIVRTVTENCRTLHFDSYSFEEK